MGQHAEHGGGLEGVPGRPVAALRVPGVRPDPLRGVQGHVGRPRPALDARRHHVLPPSDEGGGVAVQGALRVGQGVEIELAAEAARRRADQRQQGEGAEQPGRRPPHGLPHKGEQAPDRRPGDGGGVGPDDVGVAAGVACLTHLIQVRDAAYPRAERLAATLRDHVEREAERVGAAVCANQVGPIVQIFAGAQQIRRLQDAGSVNQARTSAFAADLLRSGINVIPRGLMHVSTAHGDADVAETMQALSNAMERSISWPSGAATAYTPPPRCFTGEVLGEWIQVVAATPGQRELR